MGTQDVVRAWNPHLSGVSEVFHARFVDHAYPLHTHDAWTLLVIDDGAVRYDLDHREHGAWTSVVTLLPPQVAHDGRSAFDGGFRKRVIYLEPDTIGTDLIGRAVDRPELDDRQLRLRIDQLHTVLDRPEEALQAQSRLALITDRLRWHLQGRPKESGPTDQQPSLAGTLRDLLDEHLRDGVDLSEAAGRLGTGSSQLIRAFTREFGLPPHRYLTGRRIERARRLLLAGMPIADVATEVGFYDQAHLTRHLRRMLGTTPASYRRPVTETAAGAGA
jgi:AraC-like DNA-binding protein